MEFVISLFCLGKSSAGRGWQRREHFSNARVRLSRMLQDCDLFHQLFLASHHFFTLRICLSVEEGILNFLTGRKKRIFAFPGMIFKGTSRLFTVTFGTACFVPL